MALGLGLSVLLLLLWLLSLVGPLCGGILHALLQALVMDAMQLIQWLAEEEEEEAELVVEEEGGEPRDPLLELHTFCLYFPFFF
jgi:hypothetical protein